MNSLKHTAVHQADLACITCKRAQASNVLHSSMTRFVSCFSSSPSSGERFAKIARRGVFADQERFAFERQDTAATASDSCRNFIHSFIHSASH